MRGEVPSLELVAPCEAAGDGLHERSPGGGLVGILRDRFERKGLLSAIRSSGVVLTGGGARLAGLPDLVSRLFGCPCRVGGPDNLHGMPQELRVPECATGAGV